VGNGIEIERLSAIEQDDLQGVLPREALYHDGLHRRTLVSVPNNVIRRLIDRQYHPMRGCLVQAGHVTHGFDKCTRQGQKPCLTRNGQGPGGGFGAHPVGPIQVAKKEGCFDYTQRGNRPQAFW
jgi:hypothetical protein